MFQRQTKEDLDTPGYEGPMKQGLEALVRLANDSTAKFRLPEEDLELFFDTQDGTRSPLLREEENDLNQIRAKKFTTAQVYYVLDKAKTNYRRIMDKFKNLTGANGIGDATNLFFYCFAPRTYAYVYMSTES